MWLIYIIGSFLCAAYCIIILAYRIWFKKLKPFQPDNIAAHQHQFFSVIIPARNEAFNIVNCLQSIVGNNYPQAQYEIIVVDDFSTDGTQDHVRSMQLQHSNILSEVFLKKR